MANYTLNYTGEEVDELLAKVEKCGGNMLVNLSYTGIEPVSMTQINLTGVTLDKTYDEILEAIEKGVNVKIVSTVDFSPILGEGLGYPHYSHIPFTFTQIIEGNRLIEFVMLVTLGGYQVTTEVCVTPHDGINCIVNFAPVG